jgi:hypothetical protein
MSSILGNNTALVGVDDSNTNQNSDNLFSDFATLESDFTKTFSDEYSMLKQKKNVYRILGAIGGVAAVSLYNNRDSKLPDLAMKFTMVGLAEIIAINFAKSMVHNENTHSEESMRAPTTAILYYLMSTRSLDTNIRKQPAIEAIVASISSYAVGYYLDMKPAKPAQ